MTFTKEQLIEQAKNNLIGLKNYVTVYPERADSEAMNIRLAEIALASLEAEPVACPKCNDTGMADSGGVQPWGEPISVPCDCTAQPALAVDADDNFYSWFGREWHDHYQQNQYTTAAKQMLGVMAESAWKAGRRAAMLQGADGNAPAHFRSRPAQSSLSPAQGGNSPVTPDCWVPCSERLPEETKEPDGGATGYLVLYAEGKEPNGGFNVGVWNVTYLRQWWRGFITHWMPLPAAPQQEAKGE